MGQLLPKGGISASEVNTEVDVSLNTAVPDTPTANSLNDMLSKLDGANTYDNTTDSLEAIRDKLDTISGSQIIINGVVSSGSSTTVHITDITGFGNDYFNKKAYLQVVRNDSGVGTPPEGEYRLITDYVSSTGTFTTDAFTAVVATSDSVYVIQESVIKAQFPQGFLNPINRINNEFFEDFSWVVDTSGTDISAFSELADQFVVTVGTGAIEAPDPAGADTTGKSCIEFDISGTTAFVLLPKWTVDYHDLTQLSIEGVWKISDTTNNDIVMGFSSLRTAFDNPFSGNGYGMHGTTTDYTITGFSSQNGSVTSAKTTAFVKYRVELNFTAGVIDNMKWYKDDSLLETLATVTELTNHNLNPYFNCKGAAAGDDIWLDYIRVWGS